VVVFNGPTDSLPAGGGLAPPTNGECRDGPPQLVIRRGARTLFTARTRPECGFARGEPVPWSRRCWRVKAGKPRASRHRASGGQDAQSERPDDTARACPEPVWSWSRIGRAGGERFRGLPGTALAQRPAVPPARAGGLLWSSSPKSASRRG